MIKHRAQDKNERGLSVMEKLKLDFYYGREAEQFTFYRLPKALITDACSDNEMSSHRKAQISPIRNPVNRHTRIPILQGSGLSNIYMQSCFCSILFKTRIGFEPCFT